MSDSTTSTPWVLSEAVFRRTFFFSTMGMIFAIVADDMERVHPVAGGIAHVIGFAFSLTGCTYYARVKGLPSRYGLFGLFHFIGFWILLCLAPREGADGARE